MKWGGRWARIGGILVLAVALAGLGALSFARRIGTLEPDLGVEWTQSSSGPVALAVTPDGPAWNAGVRPGDVLRRIDGAEVDSALDAGSLPWNTPAGSTLVLDLARGPETVTAELPSRWLQRPEPYGYLALVGIAFFVSGLFISLRWPNVRGGFMYAWLAAALFVHLVCSHTGRADGLDWTIYWMDRIAGAMAPALLMHFGLVLSRRAVPARRLGIAVAYAPAAAILFTDLWLAPGGLGGIYRFASPVRVAELVERVATLYLGAAVLATIVLLTRSYSRSSSTLHRSQLRWLLWGLIGGLVPFVSFYALPFSIGASTLPPWATFLSVLPLLIVPAAFTAALARYRLYDLSSLVRRGLTEVNAVFFAFAVYAVAREGASGLLGMSDSGARYTGTFVAILAYTPLRKLVQAGVDRVFYRRRYSYRATLLDWARELSAETDLQALLRRVSRRVSETLELKAARVLIRTGASRFESIEAGAGMQRLEPGRELLARLERESVVSLEAGELAELPWARWLFAMKVKGRVTALLVTADRYAPDEPLSTEDRALLGTLSAHAATAIEAARLVHEVRQRADEIGQLQARQEKILESSAVGLLLTDAAGKILAWNRALEEMYQLRREAAIGRTLGEIFPIQLVKRVEREAATAPPGDQARIYRFNLVNRAGQRLVVNLAVTPAPEEDGRGAQVITFDDVSERVKLEEQVLRQERLASLGLVAAGVAHEVNTPLTGISSYTQMLLEDLPAGDVRRATLEKIEAQTRRASNIVNSLLNLARPERTEFAEVSINDTVREVLQLFAPQTRGRNISVRTSLDAAIPAIRGNRGKIQQVLLNLLMNARDACGQDGEISVSTRRRGDRVRVEVSDNGIGIAAEDLPRIFDPFFTTKGLGKGTGLGLSISYGIVQEHGGDLHAESAPGELTRFSVELPAASVERALA